MHIANPIDYTLAKAFFSEAEIKGQKLTTGNMDTNFWLHKEKINLDVVLNIAKRYTDSKIFIISEGPNKGFYIYSESKKVCVKLIEELPKFAPFQFV